MRQLQLSQPSCPCTTGLQAPRLCPVPARCTRRRQRSRLSCRAGIALSDEDDSGDSSNELQMTRDRLNRLMDSQSMTGEDLRGLLLSKWGRSYDARLQTRNGRTYFQVMWKYKEQVSFPLSEAEYMAQLNAVAELITQWGLVSTVRDGINRSSPRGPGYTGGGGARAITIPLEIRA